MIMFKTKIRLDTMTDVNKFVSITSTINSKVYLQDGKDFCISAKSILGGLAAIEWNEIYCISEEDIYNKISMFATNE